MSNIITQFLVARNIDADLVNQITHKSFSRYSFRLGPTGLISAFEKVLREFGLLVKSINTPVLFMDFPTGLLHIDVVTGELDTILLDAALNQANILGMNIPIILGSDFNSKINCVDMSDLPHLLVGGSTGSGKSVFLHSIINTILLKSNNCKLVLIDPKKVEFSKYNKNSKLLNRVASSYDEMFNLLTHCLGLMNSRFAKLESKGCRSIKDFSGKMPYILIIIDEAQDLLVDKKIELMIRELSQKGRAAGMHMILATQHPSSKIITAAIKANFPAKVAFKTANAIYSRVLLEQNGAESLLGRGDGIFKSDQVLIRFKAPYLDINKSEPKRFLSWLGF